ncbi:MAG: type II toxin-antitoxin system VapC family toxin [Candidatus Baldrarchaeia archaeon]|mgnify:CR=1 FL=1
MPDRGVVLDSSVIAALFFPEPFSAWAETVIENFEEFFTADIAVAEVCNVAWKRIHLFKHPKEKVIDALEKAINFIEGICHIVKASDEYRNAIDIAIRTGITFYDALFLNISVQKGLKLATLDKKLVGRLKDSNYEDKLLHPYISSSAIGKSRKR